jgi:hypothetical protein
MGRHPDWVAQRILSLGQVFQPAGLQTTCRNRAIYRRPAQRCWYDAELELNPSVKKADQKRLTEIGAAG